MKLYKYTSFSAAEKIIETLKIGFNQIDNFNDPFEGRATGLWEPSHDSDSADFTTISQALLKARVNHRVLSLTREPLNPLMWAHYANSYEGVVIEFDSIVSQLNSDEFVIPASKGDMIYTRTKPTMNDFGSYYGEFLNNTEEILKRTFLFKSQDWSYEEEVRVVGELQSKHSLFKTELINGRPMSMYSFPKDSITAVYIGYNAFRPFQVVTDDLDDYIQKQQRTLGFYKTLIKWMESGIEIKGSVPEKSSWRLKEIEITLDSMVKQAQTLENQLNDELGFKY
ncbi:hypothetical protein VCHENC01_4129 [Vibrio harveyi]|uniref:DUF2971 domain-containing protein n=1 Tax=Vibrio harveyi TaxID=669 RepID=UPI00028E8FA4|nr:DUF2971 domain-containing protein [Vibrio harveyi]EKM21277.1 hypothetical protein VCHENC01_4129 [Vibrio harveyi]